MTGSPGTQYAAASRFYLDCSGILDHPLSRVMTAVNGARAVRKERGPAGIDIDLDFRFGDTSCD
jgi:hypothetical protein